MTRDILAASFNVVPVRLDYLFKPGSEEKFVSDHIFIAEYNYETVSGSSERLFFLVDQLTAWVVPLN